MTGRSSNQNLVENPARRRRSAEKYRRPFWLPASTYYILASAIALAVFFLWWAILGESDPEPLIPAAVAAGALLAAAVVLREIVLKKARNEFLLGQELINQNVRRVSPVDSAASKAPKLTLEMNASILREIERKSEAARVLAKLPEGHLEVFELCDEYLRKNKSELRSISPNSPRRNPLLHSRETVKKLHKFHLLAWASIETRLLTQDSRARVTIDEKLESAQKASGILDSAMQFYPDEPQLTESAKAVRDYIVSIKVSHLIEQAEKAAFKGNARRAINHYRDALFFLARENERSVERDLIAQKITEEIEKLKTLKT